MLSLLQAHLCIHAYANPQELSQTQELFRPQELQGIWQSGALSFTLTAKGKLVLKQGALMTRLKGLKDTAKQDFKGYWWSKEQRLCFFLDLSSRCYEFHLLHKQDVLKLKLGKRWQEFNKVSI